MIIYVPINLEDSKLTAEENREIAEALISDAIGLEIKSTIDDLKAFIRNNSTKSAYTDKNILESKFNSSYLISPFLDWENTYKVHINPYEEWYLKVVNQDLKAAVKENERSIEDILYEQDSVNHSCGNKGIDEAQREWEYNNLRSNK